MVLVRKKMCLRSSVEVYARRRRRELYVTRGVPRRAEDPILRATNTLEERDTWMVYRGGQAVDDTQRKMDGYDYGMNEHGRR